MQAMQIFFSYRLPFLNVGLLIFGQLFIDAIFGCNQKTFAFLSFYWYCGCN